MLENWFLSTYIEAYLTSLEELVDLMNPQAWNIIIFRNGFYIFFSIYLFQRGFKILIPILNPLKLFTQPYKLHINYATLFILKFSSKLYKLSSKFQSLTVKGLCWMNLIANIWKNKKHKSKDRGRDISKRRHLFRSESMRRWGPTDRPTDRYDKIYCSPRFTKYAN